MRYSKVSSNVQPSYDSVGPTLLLCPLNQELFDFSCHIDV